MSPTDVVTDDRITLDAAAVQSAEFVNIFRRTLSESQPIEVPDQVKTGLQFCKIEATFTLSATAGDGGKIALAAEPSSKHSPTLGFEHESAAEASRENKIKIELANPMCSAVPEIIKALATPTDPNRTTTSEDLDAIASRMAAILETYLKISTQGIIDQTVDQ